MNECQTTVLSALSGLAVIVAGTGVFAGVPTYTVDVISPIETTTFLTGVSEGGHLVGWQVSEGAVRGFVAKLGEGVSILPVPPGYDSSTALDANASGVIVGAVDDAGLPFDGGEPAIWTPDGSGGYEVTIPEQFDTVPSPLGGVLGVNGGMAVSVNDGGTIVGWSRFQGFQGGPATRFSRTGAPVNLQQLGFDATVEDLNENDVICGGELIFDLKTEQATDIGVPPPIQPGNVSFTNAIAFAINDSNELVVAANTAGLPTENWLTYTFSDQDGYARLNPAQVPSRFVGFYDNNNLGDVSASGGVFFEDEGVLFPGYNGLLDPAAAEWDVNIGFIANDRRVYTTGLNTSTGESAMIVLTPVAQGCNDADLAEPLGELDIADVVAFLTAFGATDPAADLAAPAGAFDIADVVELLRLFGAGCP